MYTERVQSGKKVLKITKNGVNKWTNDNKKIYIAIK